MTPYVGPETLRAFFPFYTYGPKSAAVLRMSWHVKARLAVAAWLSGAFTWTGPMSEDANSWRVALRGDCVTYAFLVRTICRCFLLPYGAFRLCFVTTGAEANGGAAFGHMTLQAVTDEGDVAIECGEKRWRPWEDYQHHDHNRELV